jgi:hypothetical protein
MKEILLTKGKKVIVDDEDYPFLARFNWIAETAYSSILPPKFYAVRRISSFTGKSYLIGIENLILSNSYNGGTRIVHKNNNSLDCRKENLEYRRSSLAVHNKRKTKSITTSKYKGVSWCKANRNWVAKMAKNYKSLWIGSFDNEKEAAEAWNKKAREVYGELAYQNKI